MTKSFIEEELERQHIGAIRSMIEGSNKTHKIIAVDNVLEILKKAKEELKKKRFKAFGYVVAWEDIEKVLGK